VREAIAASKGSRSMAQQLLLHWAEEDPKLLMGMAQPFMKAIITAAMQGEMRRLDARSAAASRGGGAGGHLSRDALSQVISRLGDAPPRQAAPAAGGAGGMRSATMTVASKAEAAAKSGDVDHQKAMMAIAKAFAVKKF
jgi:hypothetical protein